MIVMTIAMWLILLIFGAVNAGILHTVYAQDSSQYSLPFLAVYFCANCHEFDNIFQSDFLHSV